MLDRAGDGYGICGGGLGAVSLGADSRDDTFVAGGMPTIPGRNIMRTFSIRDLEMHRLTS